MKSKIYIILALGLIACVGCSDKAPPITQSTSAELDAAKKEHDYYTKATGNFGALSPQDQANYNQLAGGAAAGQVNWKMMTEHDSTKRSGGAPGGSPTTGRP